MSTSYFGRSEPDGRRLGSDLSLLGKWVQTFSTLTEPTRKYPLSQLSNPDKKTLFSDKPSEFRLKDGPNGTVKLETIEEDLETDLARWDAFFKNMDPEVLELTQHPNFHKSHQQVHQLKLAVSEGTYSALAKGVENVKLGTDIDTTRINRIEAHVLNAGKAPGMKWKHVSLDDYKPKPGEPSLSRNLSSIAVKDTKFDGQAFKAQLAKTVADSLTKSFGNASPSMEQQTTAPQQKIDPNSHSTPSQSPTHGSETSRPSPGSRSSEDAGSVFSSRTSASTVRCHAGSVQSSTLSRGADLLNYLNNLPAGNKSAVYGARNTTQASSDPVKPVLPTPYVSSQETVLQTTKVTSFPATVVVSDSLKLQLATTQFHPDVPCFDLAHRFGPAEIAPLYWTTKAGKARYLDLKLESLKLEDVKLQRDPEIALVAGGPVHIFIDLSNIIIGFYDSIKTSRGIPPQKRIKAPAFCFENFEALLSRGRKIEKKVLAGSVGAYSRRPSYMVEAEQLKYEMNILHRVPKPSSPVNKRKGRSESSSDTSGDDYFVTPMKQGEQCVDEILHLKLIQSALDKPSGGTIILATGDAAPAEYSDGFKKNVERALLCGWNVELYGWSRNISSAWRDPAFSLQWGRRFRIIELDDFCEELFGLTVESFNE
ncbi:hypothetical protein V8F20_006709 [Naviculisporaceae sp. PSN 640]